MPKPALGRGLGALLGGPPKASPAGSAPAAPAAGPATAEPAAQTDAGGVRFVALDRIRPSPLQPRKEFEPEALQELADSIREQGILQPLVVRLREDHFELITGERRWRAAQKAGLREVPVLVREADDSTVLQMALIENLQRENLNPLEEAQGYAELMERFRLRQEDVAAKVGKSRAAVANALRLLRLPSEVQSHLRQGRLSVGHAKVILSLNDPEEQRLAAERVLKKGLSVRQTEELVAQWQKRTGASRNTGAVASGPRSDAHVQALEDRLRERLGTRVQLRYRQGKGVLAIYFHSDEELERVLEIVGVKLD